MRMEQCIRIQLPISKELGKNSNVEYSDYASEYEEDYDDNEDSIVEVDDFSVEKIEHHTGTLRDYFRVLTRKKNFF